MTGWEHSFILPRHFQSATLPVLPLHPPTTFRPAAPSLHPPPYGAAAAV